MTSTNFFLQSSRRFAKSGSSVKRKRRIKEKQKMTVLVHKFRKLDLVSNRLMVHNILQAIHPLADLSSFLLSDMLKMDSHNTLHLQTMFSNSKDTIMDKTCTLHTLHLLTEVVQCMLVSTHLESFVANAYSLKTQDLLQPSTSSNRSVVED